MTVDQIAIICVITLTFILFIWGKFRYDIVAIISLCTLFMLDLVYHNVILFSNQ